jgi:hypothetical protein
MIDKKVTPTRPGVSIKRRRKACSETKAAGIKEQLHDLQSRIGRASALARSMALALDGQVLSFEIEAAEGCLGIAELLDRVRDEIEVIAQS